jgi:hypothetical protein
MFKFKILKQKYSPLNLEIPESIRELVWVGKLSDTDTVDIFTFHSDALAYKEELEQKDNSGRKYKIVEV